MQNTKTTLVQSPLEAWS